MVLYNIDLYENIIEKELATSSELQVISGYSSGSFLSKIVNQFPNVKIILFIGMYHEGISKNDHDIYTTLTTERENVFVYYQVEGRPTHIKLLEFVGETDRSTYIGSANFTDNGFKNNRELMVKGKEYTGSLFREQIAKSMICTSNNIEHYIKIYDDQEKCEHQLDLELEKCANIVSDFVYVPEEYQPKNMTRNKYIQNLRTNINGKYYENFYIEIVLDEENNPRWDTTGINRLFIDKIPSLCDTPRLPFYKVFPQNDIFDIYSDDGAHYKAKLIGINNRDLILINGSFYDYVKSRAKISGYKPISRSELELVNMTRIYFERLDKSIYYMSINR
ncbi:phospholipase D family protein [Vagococcus lutrae]|uniref:phospholipase D family protein n=1 Tax=Vagococcus lutrae TaxID=81947 RepID=UPI00288FE2C8|nr:phospholipase D family protein [Vagococcus lutrae]MDT2825773.1 phospholipase D family protein [Vagococcus lutrae]